MTGDTLRHLAIVRAPANPARPWLFVRTEGADPARALEGRDAMEAGRLAPLIFNLCGAAHGLAAARALGLPARADAGAMARESVRDHALAILHGWPSLLDGTPNRAALRHLSQPGPDAGRAVIAALAGERLAARDFASLTPAELNAWLSAGETATARILARLRRELPPDAGRAGLPELTPGDVLQAFDDDTGERAAESGTDAAQTAARTAPPPSHPEGAQKAAMGAGLPPMPQPAHRHDRAEAPRQPDSEGGMAARPALPLRETGALGRVADAPLFAALIAGEGRSLFVRLLARLADLLAQLSRPPPAPPATALGTGIAAAARGLLGHRARVADGRVARYRILSPSAWNLAPDGLLERIFAALDPAAPNARLMAGFALSAVNPCVPVTLDLQGVRHA